ncbi:MAG TPA: DNA cytosine methyltransferase [Terracidiphilus sp.]|nr:DNA cytosine methyltransferase [Terracidiphilus sp.]
MSRPIGIDLFAGAGGLSLGFEQAGFDVVAAVEIDPIHCAVHQFNFPNCTVMARSVADLTGDEIRRAAGIGRKRIDVVFGGPPCQGFSMIGQRALDDPRNGLVKHFLRLVSELKPTHFVFENVKGLTIGRHRRFLDELIESFIEIGYHISFPWQVLDAARYGVPQHRERLILFGARKGAQVPEYPAALCRPADRNEKGLLRRGPTCKEALDDLPDAEEFDALVKSDEIMVGKWKRLSNYAKDLHCSSLAGWHFGYRRKWNPFLLTSSLRTDHTAISRRRFEETEPGQIEPISRFYRLPADGLCNTLRAGTDSARGAFTSPRPIHYALPRCITVREMARLHGFPDWFRFHPTKWHGARQIGNAVPPPLGRAIASQILRGMGYAPSIGDQELAMGDAHLLELDMSGAAEYFGIVVPIARRDRKSGARKRKQFEIEGGRAIKSPLFDSLVLDSPI